MEDTTTETITLGDNLRVIADFFTRKMIEGCSAHLVQQGLPPFEPTDEEIQATITIMTDAAEYSMVDAFGRMLGGHPPDERVIAYVAERDLKNSIAESFGEEETEHFATDWPHTKETDA